MTGQQRRRSRRRRAVTILLLGAIVLGGLIAWGAVRRPTGASEGGPIVAPPPVVATTSATSTSPTAGRLRLATFNIHSGVGTDGRFDLKRIADVLRDRDLICLNEVRGAGPWWDNQARTLGQMLHRAELYAPVEIQWWRPAFGNALLTDRTVTRWHILPLRGTRSHRNAIVLDVPIGSTTLHVLMTHAGRSDDNAPGLDELAERFAALPEPAVMMGDLNASADDPGIRRLIERTGAADPVGERTRASYPTRIDYILLRGMRWTDAGLIDSNASDHPMAWADVEVDER